MTAVPSIYNTETPGIGNFPLHLRSSPVLISRSSLQLSCHYPPPTHKMQLVYLVVMLGALVAAGSADPHHQHADEGILSLAGAALY
ncbi:uncharacterized protein BO72DRAFT_49915 [Aspergillus fijiensis CBS 313.89]|uniref:Uncharacterized protein n=1 Tax=Aspergillus fijiensis CBS 313.89 TaxID=1448319 RepID=A0A8G1VT85_9EURO|nr:uncharacterized protein BO72DRAFT_49915 [Aspergillus fijiensis CBS 313.89]RAK70818.1 hypothetical protein BO72DRAFT_49915 [Aspergillus fijiensis CBS 313.89]